MLKHTLAIALLLLPATLFAQSSQPSPIPPNTAQTENPVEQRQKIAAEISRLQAQLQTVSRDSNPRQWAEIQCQLGTLWANPLAGRYLFDLEKAIAAYSAACEVFDNKADLDDWLVPRMLLVDALRQLAHDRPGKTAASCRQAIAICREALNKIKKEEKPVVWAATKGRMAQATLLLYSQDDGAGPDQFNEVIKAFEEAMALITPQSKPDMWAYFKMDTAAARKEAYSRALWKKPEILSPAIDELQAAQKVFIQLGNKRQELLCIILQLTILDLLLDSSPGKYSQQIIALGNKAEALTDENTKLSFIWVVKNTLGRGYAAKAFQENGEQRVADLKKAIDLFHEGLALLPLGIRSPAVASTHFNLALSSNQLSQESGQDKPALLGQAIVSALAVMENSKPASPEHMATAQFLPAWQKAHEEHGLSQTKPYIPPNQTPDSTTRPSASSDGRVLKIIQQLNDSLKKISVEQTSPRASILAQMSGWLLCLPETPDSDSVQRSVTASAIAAKELAKLTPFDDFFRTQSIHVAGRLLVLSQKHPPIGKNQPLDPEFQWLLNTVSNNGNLYENLWPAKPELAFAQHQAFKERLLQAIVACDSQAVLGPNGFDRAGTLATAAHLWQFVPCTTTQERIHNSKNARIAWIAALAALPLDVAPQKRDAYQLAAAIAMTSQGSDQNDWMVAVTILESMLRADPKNDRPLAKAMTAHFLSFTLEIMASALPQKKEQLLHRRIALLQSVLPVISSQTDSRTRSIGKVLQANLSRLFFVLGDIPGQDKATLWGFGVAHLKTAASLKPGEPPDLNHTTFVNSLIYWRKAYENAQLDKVIPFDDIKPAL
jgi:hypothetical protein